MNPTQRIWRVDISLSLTGTNHCDLNSGFAWRIVPIETTL